LPSVSAYTITWNNKEIDFTPPFARKTYDSLIQEYTGIDPTDSAALVKYAKSLHLDTAGKHPDVVKNDLFEAKVEKNLVNPTFVMDYPASICPLTKRKRDQPNIAERFALFVHCGMACRRQADLVSALTGCACC
jgi:lysyl-tRNA synthetase class 2